MAIHEAARHGQYRLHHLVWTAGKELRPWCMELNQDHRHTSSSTVLQDMCQFKPQIVGRMSNMIRHISAGLQVPIDKNLPASADKC